MSASKTQPHDGAPVVELDRVSKSFGNTAVLQDVTLSIQAGEVVAIIGPSGSGKSTLLRTINGLERIDSGTIKIDGRPLPVEVRDLAKARASIGMVFQQFNLFQNKSALQNVSMGPVHVQHISRDKAAKQATEMLARVGLRGYENRHPSQLSGGQQQRVAIARALAMDPKVMLFDEPTSALDPEMVTEVLNVIRQVVSQGMTVLLVTHELAFARSVASRIIFVDNGKILVDTEPRRFFQDQEHPRAKEFLAKVLAH